MEQFLLSPDVAVQRTPQTQSVDNAAPGNDGENFNPILEEAVAGQQRLPGGQQESGDHGQSGLGEEKGANGTPNLAGSAIVSGLIEQTIAAETVGGAVAVETVSTNIINQSLQITTPNHTELSAASLKQPATSLPTPNAALAPTTEMVAPEIGTQFKLASPSLLTESPSLPTESSTPAGSTTKAETILLQQIQQIIDEGKNIGAITIKSANTSTAGNKEQIDNLQMLSSPVLNETETEVIQVRQTAITQLLPGEQKTITPNNSKPESGRQEVTEQFLNAKIGEAQSDSQGQTTNQQSDQKGNDGQNKNGILNTTASATPVVTETATNDTSFSNQLRSSELATNPTTGSIEGKFAPGATQVVPEKELVANLVQRFNVNPRLQTSKLTLQLHPAELGQIKIDILVKGDTISANIIAQSQQVLETLDKNLNRLRGVLEDQGFNIDSFEITLQADSEKQQNLFQEHFDSQQQFAANSKKTSIQAEDSFETLLDSEESDSEHKESGLNVTA